MIYIPDSSKMHAVYHDWPNIARDAYAKNSNKIDLDPTNHIVFAGMGVLELLVISFRQYYLKQIFT